MRARALALACVAAALFSAAGAAVAARTVAHPVTVKSIAVNGTAVAGGALSFTVTVAPTTPPKPVKVTILLSTDRRFDRADTVLGTVTVPKVRQGTPRKQGSAQLPRTVSGPRYVLACSSKTTCRAAAISVKGPLLPTPPSPPAPPAPSPPARPPTQPSGPDVTPPDTSFTDSPGAYSPTRTPHLAFASSEAGSRFECRSGADPFAACTSPLVLGPLADGPGYHFEARAIDPAGNVDPTPAALTFAVSPPPPPTGPSEAPAAAAATLAPPVAPPTGSQETPDVASANSFLVTGADPIQKSVADGALESEHEAMLRGAVRDREGKGIGGVRVSVDGYPELGYTATDESGHFAMLVNGGGALTLRFARDGYLPVERTLPVTWQSTGVLDDVVLVPVSPDVTAVPLSDLNSTAVVRSGQVNDEDGKRRSTLLFDPGTVAQTHTPGGAVESLDEISVRATEFTVGGTGDEAMPGSLPGSSAYTYATEFTVDQTLDAQGGNVTFSKPVVNYVENYLQLPVGTAVPTGYYDRAHNRWVPARGGLVIGLVAIGVDGLANIDLDGDGQAEDAAQLLAAGIDETERRKVGSLYQAGQSLWRVELTHFSAWDYNYPYGPPKGAKPVKAKKPRKGFLGALCSLFGSIVGCDDQTLGERVPIAGTDLALTYQSDRQPGSLAARSLAIPVTGAEVPSVLKRVDVTIEVAGRKFVFTRAPKPDDVIAFTWDGKDAFGRFLSGRQPVKVTVGWIYDGEYYAPADFAESFAAFGTTSLARVGRQELESTQTWEGRIGASTLPPSELGGWSLSALNDLDRVGGVLYLGSGGRRDADAADVSVISTLAGVQPSPPGVDVALDHPTDLAIEPDGRILVADTGSDVVRAIDPVTRTVETIAGNGSEGFSGDGGPATQSQLHDPQDVAVAPDGSILIADTGNRRIRRVAPDGTISTVAGSGAATGADQDGVAATATALQDPTDVAVASDGTIYVVEGAADRIRRIATDGLISAFAGTGTAGFGGDGGVATGARLNSPSDIAVAPDGTVLIADTANERIRRVVPSGVIDTVAGNGVRGFAGDGGPAVEAQLNRPAGVATGRDGRIFVADTGNDRVRQISLGGQLNTLAGTGQDGPGGDGGPASKAELDFPSGLGASQDGKLLIVDTGNRAIRQVASAFGSIEIGEQAIPSADGNETYVFDSDGRQLRTLDTLSGHVRWRFERDDHGRLSAIVDERGGRTTIERDAGGKPTAIVAPGGARTALSYDANGRLASIVDPGGGATALTTGPDGLLTKFDSPGPAVSDMTYDSVGRLHTDADATGRTLTLDRSEDEDGTQVDARLNDGRHWSYRSSEDEDGSVKRTVTNIDGTTTVAVNRPDGSQTTTFADGSRLDVQSAPDPRWGAVVPVLKRVDYTTPGGRHLVSQEATSALLKTPGDPLSVDSISHVTALGSLPQTTTSWSAADRRTTSTTPTGRTLTTTYDGDGHATQTTASGGTDTSLAYEDGRVSSIEGGGAELQVAYDDQGRPVRQRAVGLGDRLLGWDDNWRLTSETRDDGGVTTYTRRADGAIVAVTPPGRPAHTIERDASGRITAYRPPAVPGVSGDWTYSYGPSGVLGSYTVGQRQVTIARDSAQRPTRTVSGDTAAAATYDSAGRLASQSSEQAGQATIGSTLDYDGGLIVATHQTGPVAGDVLEEYDDLLRPTRERLGAADAGIQRVYDYGGRLAGIGPLGLGYGSQDQVQAISIGNSSTYLNHESSGPVSSISTGDGSWSQTFERDGAERVTRRTEAIGGTTTVQTYAYDGAGRLSEIRNGTGTLLARYGYDANGNRTSVQAGGTVNATYDAQDRIKTLGTTTFAEDDAGSVTARTGSTPATSWSYGYDGFGHLVRAARGDGRTISYRLDANGRVIQRLDNGSVTARYLYGPSANGPIASIAADGSVVDRYLYGTNPYVPDAFQRNGKSYRLVAEPNGTVRFVVDAADNTVVQRLDYDAFGVVTQDTNPGFQPFGFAGGIYDPVTGLTRFGVRDYDAAAGRFLEKDPLGLDGGLTNLYQYAAGDPVNLTDPEGTCTPLTVGLGAAIGGGLSLFKSKACDGDSWGTSLAHAGVGAVAGGIAGCVGPVLAANLAGASGYTAAGAAVARGGAMGALSGGYQSVGDQLIDHGRVDPGQLTHDTLWGGANGLVGGFVGTKLPSPPGGSQQLRYKGRFTSVQAPSTPQGEILDAVVGQQVDSLIGIDAHIADGDVTDYLSGQ
jgi:RHS repeat-associated protein